MAGIVPVFILLDKASIYAFLDLAFDPVDVVCWGGVWTLYHHRPFKLRFEFQVHLFCTVHPLDPRGARGCVSFHSRLHSVSVMVRL